MFLSKQPYCQSSASSIILPSGFSRCHQPTQQSPPRFLTLFVCVSAGADATQRFTLHPEDAQVIKGQTHIFQCAVADLVGQVQWMKDGFGLGYDRDLPGYSRYSIIGSQAHGIVNIDYLID